jgi:hypothetical protein
MKNVFILILMISMTGGIYAQKGQSERWSESDWTPEQIAELKTKKMALALDLSDQQQSKLMAVNQQWANKQKSLKEKFQKERAEAETLSSDQKFEHHSQMLDLQIEYQKEMKGLLNEEQYTDWKSMRKRTMHKKVMHKKRQGPRSERGPKGSRS